MARRSDHSREELKDLAIQAGFKIIKEEGFAHFSARRVAAEIGYTVGTIYHVFGTYDNLMLNIHAVTLDSWYAAMEKTFRKHKGEKAVQALAQFYIRYSRTHYNEWIALFEYHLSEDKQVPDWYMPKTERFFALVENLLLPILSNNRKKAKRAARVLWAGIHGICILSLSKKLDLAGAESAEILATSFVENYMAGLTRG